MLLAGHVGASQRVEAAGRARRAIAKEGKMTMIRKALLAGMLSLCSLYGGTASADLRHGMEQRPDNATCLAPQLPASTIDLKIEPAFSGRSFSRVVDADQMPGQPDRWYVLERGGLLKTSGVNFASEPAIALDLRDKVQFTALDDLSNSQQAGLTALAFHPQFQNPAFRFIYVGYNVKASPTAPVISYVSRFELDGAGPGFKKDSEKVILQLPQETVWHHVGQVIFGPADGYLYLGFGDGSNVLPDQRAWRAQDPFSLYGKILRIDVDRQDPGKNYAIPPDNPFAGGAQGAPEVWAMGFRNPWRFSFDRQTSTLTKPDIWLGDVGQGAREEINRISKAANYGWPFFEGDVCTQPAATCAAAKPRLTDAVYIFNHQQGQAAIGGFVYRGSRIPGLIGTYVFGAVGVNTLWGLQPAGNPPYPKLDLTPLPWGAHGFAEDFDGELYLWNSQRPGPIYKIVPNDAVGGGGTVAAKLSETGCFASTNPMTLAPGVIPYDLNNPLYSDGAGKLRGMALPNGGQITVTANNDFDFPERTVFVKTFTFNTLAHGPNTPIETRLFMRHPGGIWQGYSYEWRDDLSDADLLPAGKQKTITLFNNRQLTWTYPSRGQCTFCHNENAGSTLGPEVAQINRDYTFPNGRISNQIATWQHVGLFANLVTPPNQLPALASRTLGLSTTPIERRARAYLHSNCGGCHREPASAQAAIDLTYWTPTAATGACNAVPLSGSLGNPLNRLIAPGDPAHSVLSLRMKRRDALGMPPLGTAIPDYTMIPVVDAWLSDPTICDAASSADFDADGVPDRVDNCTTVFNPDQADTDRDGYGNRCDGDFNNDGITDATDGALLTSKLRTQRNGAGYQARLDINNDMVIDTWDVTLFNGLVGRAPGPSAVHP